SSAGRGTSRAPSARTSTSRWSPAGRRAAWTAGRRYRQRRRWRMPERAAPPRRGEGRPLPDRGGRMTAADLDLQAIARRAADAPPGTTPAALIDRALREAGVEGSYQTSRQYRRLWHQAAQYTCDILRERLLAAGVQASRTAGRGPRRAFRRRRYDRPIGDQVRARV